MQPLGVRPARHRVATWLVAMTALAMVLATMPAASAMTAGGLKVDLEVSEDLVVMNSDVGLTVTVRDAATGEPVNGCQVVLHVARKVEDGMNDDHMHGTPREVPVGVAAPSVDISVTPDPKAGWNLRVETTDFRWAPERASTEHVWGEGHAHLYVDGTKVGRLYGEHYHLSGLDVGTHQVRVALSWNDHIDISSGGRLVEDTETVVVEEAEPHGHGMMPPYEVPDGVPVPAVDLVVHQDAKAGWNLQVVTTDFRWAPENASTPAVMGEGHAHVYVDGHKLARLYGEWFHLASLTEGEHQVRVTLNANDHSDYARGGQVIEDSEAITVPPGEDGDGEHGGTTMTLDAGPGKAPGRYVARHSFERAGDYVIEVHVSGASYEEVAVTYELEVLEGDPASLTIAGVVLYVTLAIVIIVGVQYAMARRRVRRLQEFSAGEGDEALSGDGG